MDEDTLKDVETKVKDGIYRNKSHLIELATKTYLKDILQNGKEKNL